MKTLVSFPSATSSQHLAEPANDAAPAVPAQAACSFGGSLVHPAGPRPELEQQAGDDDGDGGASHGEAGHHGVHVEAYREEEAHGDGQADEVIEASPAEVHLDAAEDGAGKGEGGGDAQEIGGTHEDHVGSLHGDIGARGHGDADVGGGKRGGVVDAVADHGDDSAGGLHLPNDGLLLVGRDAGVDVVGVDAYGGGDGKRSGALVTGDNGRLDLHAVKHGNGGRRAVLDGVSEAEVASVLAVDGDKDVGGAGRGRGAARGGGRFSGGGGLGLGGGSVDVELLGGLDGVLGHGDAVVVEVLEVAGDDVVALDLCDDTLADADLEIADATVNGRIRSEAELVLGSTDDGFTNGMLAAHLREADCGPPGAFAGIAGAPRRCERHARDAHLAVGNGARLVEHHLGHLCGTLERCAALDEDAVFGAHARADHDSRGRREAQRARASKDDDGDAQLDADHDFATARVLQEDLRRVRQHVGEYHPGEKRAEAEHEDRGYKVARDRVGDLLNRRARRLRVLHKPHNLTELSVTAGARDAEVDPAITVDGAANDIVAETFLDGHGLTRNHALVDVGFAADHGAISGDLVARSNNDNVAELQQLDPSEPGARGVRGVVASLDLAQASAAFSAAMGSA
ncbi:hypothetical protein CRV24_002152 [Beauveria bassiana]|nr:hypothetical protein CRV24_002152 [Beauveria bassiana]